VGKVLYIVRFRVKMEKFSLRKISEIAAHKWLRRKLKIKNKKAKMSKACYITTLRQRKMAL
jgi:hypothetical protein